MVLETITIPAQPDFDVLQVFVTANGDAVAVERWRVIAWEIKPTGEIVPITPDWRINACWQAWLDWLESGDDSDSPKRDVALQHPDGQLVGVCGDVHPSLDFYTRHLRARTNRRPAPTRQAGEMPAWATA